MRRTIRGADQAVVLSQSDGEWSWHDGVNDNSGFSSELEALEDYLGNPVDTSEGYVPVSEITIETRFRRSAGPLS